MSISVSIAHAVSTIPHSGLNSPVTSNNNPQLLQSIQQMRLRRLQHQQSTSTMTITGNTQGQGLGQNQGFVLGQGPLGQATTTIDTTTTATTNTTTNNDIVTAAALQLAGMRSARAAHVQPTQHGMQGLGGRGPGLGQGRGRGRAQAVELHQQVGTTSSSSSSSLLPQSQTPQSQTPQPQPQRQQAQIQEQVQEAWAKDEQPPMVIAEEESNHPLPQPMSITTGSHDKINNNNRATLHRAI